MVTQKQIDASRRNAQHSTGPVTDLGKATAKFNALQHGMTAVTAVLPYEDADSYDQLRKAFETAAFNMGMRGLKKKWPHGGRRPDPRRCPQR